MPPLQDLTLAELRARQAAVFRHGGGSRPEVLLVRVDGTPAVLKDYTRCDPWFRRLIGPLSVRREARALTQLAGTPGVPRLLRTVGRDAILIEYIEGRSNRELKPGAYPPEFFERCYRLIEAIHRRGVAHCDLRSQGNILMTPPGEPYFVDFVAHFRRPRTWNPPMRWAFGQFCAADRVAVARLKKSHAPELLTPEEQALLARDRKTPLERLARLIGKSIRNVSRWLLTKRTGEKKT